MAVPGIPDPDAGLDRTADHRQRSGLVWATFAVGVAAMVAAVSLVLIGQKEAAGVLAVTASAVCAVGGVRVTVVIRK